MICSGFAANLRDILGLLLELQKTYDKIFELARTGKSDENTLKQINDLGNIIYGEFMGDDNGIIGKIKEQMMMFKDAVDKNYEGIARKSDELVEHINSFLIAVPFRTKNSYDR